LFWGGGGLFKVGLIYINDLWVGPCLFSKLTKGGPGELKYMFTEIPPTPTLPPISDLGHQYQLKTKVLSHAMKIPDVGSSYSHGSSCADTLRTSGST